MNYAATETLTLTIDEMFEVRRALASAAACPNASGCLPSILESVDARISAALDAAAAKQLAAA